MGLSGKSVLVTRRREQAAEMVREIERLGGRAVVIPMIGIANPDSWAAADAAIARISSFDAIVFASANAAEQFFARCATAGLRKTGLEHLMVYAVGTKTRERVERSGLRVEVVPDEFSASALAEIFAKKRMRGKSVLIPGGDLSGSELDEALTKAGASVERIIVYKTVRPASSERGRIRDQVLGGEVNVLTFASPSAVAHFAELFASDERLLIRSRCVIGVIGPTTRHAASEAGLDATVIAHEATGIGLVRAISEYCS